ncbi:hypothetical protein QY95_03897 [Bacillus thermotolerans]|uniref:Uncharacterized protein n=1 Tax=Bacillus thermotolerans TaxID=1221996 RepID=A0A0F5HMF7_BACTR|nr:hypothetical protein QY95_03897 [Bacillus thermotolerans]
MSAARLSTLVDRNGRRVDSCGLTARPAESEAPAMEINLSFTGEIKSKEHSP